MKLTSIIAIYAMFWVFSAFLVLPFGLRTPDEVGENKVAGQAESAPVNFKPRKVAMRATVLSAVLFGAYYLIYTNGWLSPDDLDLTRAYDSRPALPKQ